ncbi:MAG TPA: hypothetical protein VN903_15420 [Polyangia bacterium]|nr:hypothetical protein [Polyangia bacterium]
MGIPCFSVEPSEEAVRELRRYARTSDGWTCEGGYHSVSVRLPGTFPVAWSEPDPEDGFRSLAALDPASYDGETPWPTHCTCGYEFRQEDHWQLNQHQLYVATDGPMVGQRWPQNELPPGAIWTAWWMHSQWAGINGTDTVLMVKLPSGQEFLPGMEATNCTRKGEDHDCWCVHGEVPNLTINKQPVEGRSTCQAGAGSIDSCAGTPRHWHGFVTNGELVG